MRFTEVDYTDAAPVEGYGPGFFRIGGEVIEGAAVTGPAGTGPWGGYDDLDPLRLLEGQIDVLFLGTGAEIAHPPEAFRSAVEALGIGIEVMASPVAARTYNVLLSEGRRVALAVLPV
ncbi:MAG: Mth938-like domain-containing protein [Pseudomonadota bacterium]